LGLSRRHQPRRQPRRFTAQGFFGGVLIPMAFTLVFTKLPQQQKPIGLAMFALAVTFAPAIGRPSGAISPRITAGRPSSSPTSCAPSARR
jgi:MFS family permease